MRRGTEAVVLTMLGVMVLRLTLTGQYLDFVRAWTRIPLIACGVLLIACSIGRALWRPPEDPGERPHARISWLLLAPIVVVFAVRPGDLGAYAAEHQGRSVAPPRPASAPVLRPTGPTTLGVFEYTQVAAYDGDFIDGAPVDIVGFASTDQGSSDGSWYLTRLSITCCAADALASRILVSGAPAPPRNTWVRIEGTGVASRKPEDATVQVKNVVRVPKPSDPYEH